MNKSDLDNNLERKKTHRNSAFRVHGLYASSSVLIFLPCKNLDECCVQKACRKEESQEHQGSCRDHFKAE